MKIKKETRYFKHYSFTLLEQEEYQKVLIFLDAHIAWGFF